jgi:hypothetical protein
MAWLAAGPDFTFVVQTMGGDDLGGGWRASVPRVAGFAPDGSWWSCPTVDCEPTDVHGVVVPVVPVIGFPQRAVPMLVVPRRRNGGIDQADTGARCYAFHPDGTRYLSCSLDGLVRVWDLRRL